MRTRIATLVAVAALALPLASVSTASAQAAVRYQLTVRIYDRSGHPSSVAAQVINTQSDISFFVGTGHHLDLGRGTYNVAAWILTGPSDDPTYTLADQVVTLSGNRTVVLDARQGRPVRLRLDNAAAYAETLEISPIVHGFWAFDPTTVYPPVGKTYIVPMRSTLMALYVYSVWEKKGSTISRPSPFRYDIVNVFRHEIPAGAVIRTKTAQLARIETTVRATAADQQATLQLSPQPASVILPTNAETNLGTTPARIVSYRSPWFQWQPLVDWTSPSGGFRDNDVSQPAYGPGRHSETFGAAVFGPGQFDVGATVFGRRLSVGLEDVPIEDSLHPSDEGTATEALSLYQGKREIAHSSGGGLSARIPLGNSAYSFHLTATQPAAALLSTRVSGTWNFIGQGTSPENSTSPEVYSAVLNALGLDLRNNAAGGSRTSITMDVWTAGGALGLVAQASAWWSSNDGKTWGRVPIRIAGDHYVITVHNSRTAGFTSLRVLVGDGQGNSEELTVIHAYGVR